MKYLKVFTDFISSLDPLGDAECGRLFKAMLEYAKTGQEPDLRGNERFIWPTAKQSIDRDANTYSRKVDAAQKATEARKRNDNERKRNDNVNECYVYAQGKDKDKDKDKDKREEAIASKRKSAVRFIPPTIDEVAAYCRERGNSVDAERFVDFYTAKGWKVGKNPMKDWKAAVRTWEKEDGNGNHRNQSCGMDREKAQRSDEKWGITYSA